LSAPAPDRQPQFLSRHKLTHRVSGSQRTAAPWQSEECDFGIERKVTGD